MRMKFCGRAQSPSCEVVLFRRDPHVQRPPYFGPRMKWTMVIVVLVSVLSYVVQHWWTAWVKQGLGW